jgi:hypothetical protein
MVVVEQRPRLRNERRDGACRNQDSKSGGTGPVPPLLAVLDQWKLSPHAHEPVALGLSIVKPCFSIVSTKSIVAPLR